MRRREFVSGAAGALAWPLATRAQQSPVPVIGFLSATLPTDPQMLPAYRQGLSVAGSAEGRNVAIEYRSADYPPAQLDDCKAAQRKVTQYHWCISRLLRLHGEVDGYTR